MKRSCSHFTGRPQPTPGLSGFKCGSPYNGCFASNAESFLNLFGAIEPFSEQGSFLLTATSIGNRTRTGFEEEIVGGGLIVSMGDRGRILVAGFGQRGSL